MDGRGLIGIVSGLGPLAGSDVLDKALAYAAEAYGAVDDAEYPDIVLFSHGIENFDSTGSIEDNFVQELIGVVQEIELHHPTVLGIACNTAHLHLSALQAHTQAQIVNLIEATADAACSFDCSYLLLSSSTTRQTRLYHDALLRRGVRFVDVSDSVQLEVDDVVHAVMAHEFDRAAALIDEVIGRLENAPFNGIIAGGTELPIALDQSDASDVFPIIDSNRVLAHALVDTYFRIPRRERVLVRAGFERGLT